MSRDKSGNGGLSFGPPPPRDERQADIGFAPDLDERVQEVPPLPAFTETRAPPPRDTASPRRSVSYPLAEACLQRLLGAHSTPQVDGENALPRSDGTSTAPREEQPFLIGPAVMRPPPSLSRPPSERASSVDDGEPATLGHTDALLEDLVDVLLVGEDSGKPEVHLSFKPEVFGGLYLRLERREDGLFAHFSVPDDHARRAVQGHIDDLLARLSSAGFAICGSSLHVQENP